MIQRLKAHWLRRRIAARGGRPRRGIAPYDDVTTDLREAGVAVDPYAVPVEDFQAYVGAAGYDRLEYYDHGHDPFAREKCLEHFV